MADHYSGKDAWAEVDGVSLYGRKWALESQTDEKDVTNFRSPEAPDGSKWREFIGGFSGGTLSIDLVYEPSMTLPVRGEKVPFELGIGESHAATGEMITTGLSYTQDIDGVALVVLRGRVTGPPVIS